MNAGSRTVLAGAEPLKRSSSSGTGAVRLGCRRAWRGLLLSTLLLGGWCGPVRADAVLTRPAANQAVVAATHLSATHLPAAKAPAESAPTTERASAEAGDAAGNGAELVQPAAVAATEPTPTEATPTEATPTEATSTEATSTEATSPEPTRSVASPAESMAVEGWSAWVDPQRLAGTLQLTLTMTFVGLAPAVLLLTTSYVRISIVLAVLRQAFGTQQLMPLQVTTALAMFCTGFVMWPTWTTVHQQAVAPWMQGAEPPAWTELAESALGPIREFMVRQIDHQGNADDVHLFVKRLVTAETYPTSYDEVPFRALMPAFLLSELKTAFLIGFQIYLPFLVIDLVVAAVTTSMGMFMLPPTTVSLPLKLLLFVLVDGWRLLVEMLLNSFL